ncbi:MAG TPA: crosslink repair DNA glycosylase YcaQ family protein, partial [Solirubrobacteraceae bacterium]|nr:crosslink repair DNA glycosylase YcaQ family protein [Solirubrobacteraceae bacterium]
DLGDYYRLPRSDSKARVAELVEAGELLEVAVEGWAAPAYLWPQSRAPRRIEARALLSPFDSLIWFRPRTERLFQFRYRIEIYTPAPKRQYGYYVLPFLLGDELVGRVDLKADRAAGVLQVRAAWSETPSPAPEVAEELAAELAELAGGPGALAERALELLAVAGDAPASGSGEADGALRLAGHLAESAWLAAPDDPATQRARHEVFAARAARATSTMAKGVFTWAANEAGGGSAGGGGGAGHPHAH